MVTVIGPQVDQNTVYQAPSTDHFQVKVGANVKAGTAVKVNEIVGVTSTATPDVTTPGVWGQPVNAGGKGNLPQNAVVALSGAYLFPVTGVTAATEDGTRVYIRSGELTVVAPSSQSPADPFGVVLGNANGNTAAKTLVKVGV
jgi:hypothetical protein